MRKLYYLEIVFILVLALLVSTVFPSYLSSKQEQQLLNQTETEEVAAVRVSRTEKMEEKSALEKFMFLLDEEIEYIEYMPLSEGKTMDAVDAMDQVLNELQILFDMGVLPSGEFDVASGKLYTAANISDPGQSLTVWRFLVTGAFGETYIVAMDDTDGKILSLKSVSFVVNTAEYYGDAYQLVAHLWGDYLGMTDMIVRDIRYSEAEFDCVTERMGDMKNQILELYGMTEGQVKDAIQNMAADEYMADSQRQRIELELSYYMENGDKTECMLEWDFAGYQFCPVK